MDQLRDDVEQGYEPALDLVQFGQLRRHRPGVRELQVHKVVKVDLFEERQVVRRGGRLGTVVEVIQVHGHSIIFSRSIELVFVHRRRLTVVAPLVCSIRVRVAPFAVSLFTPAPTSSRPGNRRLAALAADMERAGHKRRKALLILENFLDVLSKFRMLRLKQVRQIQNRVVSRLRSATPANFGREPLAREPEWRGVLAAPASACPVPNVSSLISQD